MAKERTVTEKEVMAVKSPPYTDTWRPVSHREVIDAMEIACIATGIGVKSRTYSMNKYGTRLFGLWTLDVKVGNGKQMDYMLGFRNALDKSFALGACAGTHIMVCSNMMFSGDFITFRKHTSGLDQEELGRIAEDAVGGAVIEMEKLKDWQNGMQEIWVPKEDQKILTYDMMEAGVFSGSQFNKYLACLEEEKELENTVGGDLSSLYAMHGAVTRLMRGWNLLKVSESSARLKTVCDDYQQQLAA